MCVCEKVVMRALVCFLDHVCFLNVFNVLNEHVVMDFYFALIISYLSVYFFFRNQLITSPIT